MFFFWTGLVLQLCVAIGFFKTQTSPFATAMHFWLVGHEDLFSLQPTLVTLARRRRISCDKTGFYLRFFFAPRYGGALKNQPFLVPIRISPQWVRNFFHPPCFPISVRCRLSEFNASDASVGLMLLTRAGFKWWDRKFTRMCRLWCRVVHTRTRSEVIRGCCFASPRISVQQKFSFLWTSGQH